MFQHLFASRSIEHKTNSKTISMYIGQIKKISSTHGQKIKNNKSTTSVCET